MSRATRRGTGKAVLVVAFVWAGLNATGVPADDWPQFMGPQRDAVWRESGICASLPKVAEAVRWRVPVAGGYSGPAVADGRVFVMDYVRKSGEAFNNPGRRATLDGYERVLCFDAKTGKRLWSHQYHRPYNISYPAGPRCTPTVDGDRVYTLGAEGDLLCLDVQTGKVLWSRQLRDEYQTRTPIWGYASHPLVVGDTLYCVAGGRGSVAVALDKRTGEEKWRALSARGPGYCPPSLIEVHGQKQLLVWHAEGLNALDPATGKRLWSVPLVPDYGMAILPPVRWKEFLFCSNLGVSCLLRLDETAAKANVVWEGGPRQGLFSATCWPVVEQGVVYGVHCRDGALRAVRLETGEILWETFQPTTGSRRGSYGTAFLVKHQDHYFLFNDQGDLILARLTPEKYEELGRVHVLDPTNEAFGRDVVWSPPAFANRCLFVRNDKELVCLSLAAE